MHVSVLIIQYEGSQWLKAHLLKPWVAHRLEDCGWSICKLLPSSFDTSDKGYLFKNNLIKLSYSYYSLAREICEIKLGLKCTLQENQQMR